MDAQPKSIAICTPGNSFSDDWLAAFESLLLHVIQRHPVMRQYGRSNNIYCVRNHIANSIMSAPRKPDYVLWIDSDNPPTVEGFEWLMAAIEASPEVGAVGGWYRFQGPNGSLIAAGTKESRPTEEEILKAESLIEVGYIGFGFLLMRYEMLEALGPYPFQPTYLDEFATDDGGFCDRAVAKGFKFYLHPKVFVEHLKMGKVPAIPPVSKSEKGE